MKQEGASSAGFVGDFWQGAATARPIVLGYFGIGLTCGIAGANAGLSPSEVFCLSLLVFAGSAQFVFAQLWTAGAWVLWPAIFFLNFRHFLYSASFAPLVRELSPKMRFGIGTQLTDETFSLASAILNGRHLRTGSWMLGLNLAAYSSWCLSNLLGALLGDNLEGTDALGLDFALPAMYAAIFVLLVRAFRKEKNTILMVAVVAAGATIGLGLLYPHPSNVLIAAMLAASLGLIFFGPKKAKKAGKTKNNSGKQSQPPA